MHPKRSLFRQMPQPAQSLEGTFWFLFNVVNLLNGIIGLIGNIIDLVEEVFGGGSNA